MVVNDPQAIDQVIEDFSRTTDQAFTLEEFRSMLSSGRQLRMKYGVDVTAPDLHVGHAVNLWMLRRLQDLGHKVIFLVGDFTTQIGDPTGRSATRPIIPMEDIRRNTEAFIAQATMVLRAGPELMEIRRNSEWFDAMPAKNLLSLMSMVTHGRLIARDMFKKRIAEGLDIYVHELIYPILQGYDSVMIDSDLTIIGSDQLFNEMLGRYIQAKHGQREQVIITTKITPGIDGKDKQSKSLGNYIGLNHSPRDKFGRVMSIPDNLVAQYLAVYTDVPMDEVRQLEAQAGADPMGVKVRLAEEIVKRYHGPEVARQEHDWFRKVFSGREAPEEMPTVRVGQGPQTAFAVLRHCFAAEDKSNSELRRLLEQNAVRIDGQTVSQADAAVTVRPEGTTIKVGKRNWFRVMP